ncbi:protein ACCELERATED CELL DEATH [Salix suchowensis]|nr:protein ACCELERATED CELL DEATH [Salix suchowensis]
MDERISNFMYSCGCSHHYNYVYCCVYCSRRQLLMFLGILTSRYAEEDFLKSLPKKLIFGLSTLFLSIAAMMVTFCAALIIMLNGRLEVVIPVVLLASIPWRFLCPHMDQESSTRK